jgi:DNA-binding CsgD family transcriptional regulator
MREPKQTHLEILPMLVRCAIPTASPATHYQIRRLIDALDADGETVVAGKLRALLGGVEDLSTLQLMVADAPKGSARRRRLQAALRAYSDPSHAHSEGQATTSARAKAVAALPTAQRNVLDYVNEGKRDGEIAQALGVSIHTVRNHIKVLLKKFGVNSGSQLIVATRK